LTVTHAVEIGMQGLEHIRITGKEMLPADQAEKIDFLPLATRETLLWQQFDLQSEKMRTLIAFLAKSFRTLGSRSAADCDSFAVAAASRSVRKRLGMPQL